LEQHDGEVMMTESLFLSGQSVVANNE